MDDLKILGKILATFGLLCPWGLLYALLSSTPKPEKTKPEPAPKLQVWFGAMPESNGKSNWTAILHKGDLSEGHTIARSEYKDQIRYYADKVRWLIGELDERPFILDYDGALKDDVIVWK